MWVRLCECVCVSAFVWVRLCECVCVSAFVWVRLCECVCVSAFVWVRLCECVCVRLCVCVGGDVCVGGEGGEEWWWWWWWVGGCCVCRSLDSNLMWWWVGGWVGVVFVVRYSNLTADSLRGVHQDKWSSTASSGKANDWRTREHVVLDLFSNWKCVRSKRFFRGTSLRHVMFYVHISVSRTDGDPPSPLPSPSSSRVSVRKTSVRSFLIYTRRFFLRAKPRQTHPNTHNTHTTHTTHTNTQQHTKTEKSGQKEREEEIKDERQEKATRKTRWKTRRGRREDKMKDKTREDQEIQTRSRWNVVWLWLFLFLFKITRPSNNFEFSKLPVTNPEHDFLPGIFFVCAIAN